MSSGGRGARKRTHVNYAELDDGDADFDGDIVRTKRKKELDEEYEEIEDSGTRSVSTVGGRGGSGGNLRSQPASRRFDQRIEISHDTQILDLSRSLTLKKDHESRPIWISSDGIILLEAFSRLYQHAYDFLVAVAEPLARPKHIHKYILTSNSLYAAVSVNIDTETIIKWHEHGD